MPTHLVIVRRKPITFPITLSIDASASTFTVVSPVSANTGTAFPPKRNIERAVSIKKPFVLKFFNFSLISFFSFSGIDFFH